MELFDKKMLHVLACPLCKGKLQYNRKTEELICRFDKLAYSIQDGVPIMLENKARVLKE